MLTELMMRVSVPFDKSQVQVVSSKNMQRKKMEIVQNRRLTKDSPVPRRYISRKELTPAEKLQLRRERNRILAQTSRMKAKHDEKHLKERLLQLEYETMKLLLENESLKRQNVKLEEEHQSLKLKSESPCYKSMVKENSIEATFKHASFVNVPLQKEWVLLVFLTIILSLWEEMKQNAIILNQLMVYVNKQLTLSKEMKQKWSLECFLMRIMMHLPCYLLHIPLVPNR